MKSKTEVNGSVQWSLCIGLNATEYNINTVWLVANRQYPYFVINPGVTEEST